MRNRQAVFGLVVLLVFIILAVFADVLFDYENVVIKRNIAHKLEGPSAEHWFGTDELGRDVLARLVWGGRISVFVGFVAVAISLTLGLPLGAIAGFYGGKLSEVIMRFTDILNALPSIMLALCLMAALGQNMANMILAVGISSIPGYIRIVRASVLMVKRMEYIDAARVGGSRNWEIILFNVLHNCTAPIIVQATMRIASAILAVAGLSFLGMGIKAPTPEWGLMLSAGRAYLRNDWYLTFFPGMAIFLVVLSLNLLGDGLRDALDPKLK
jgi:peptide/nickel transport system permease protein